jgi:hypothetical protein
MHTNRGISYVHDGQESMRTVVGCVTRSETLLALKATGESRTTGGAAHAPGRRTSCHDGIPLVPEEGTTRRIVRPADPAEQAACSSGKRKDHTGKNVLLVTALSPLYPAPEPERWGTVFKVTSTAGLK